MDKLLLWNYRPSSTVTVTSLTVHVSSSLPDNESPSAGLFPRQYPGCFGCGIDTKSLLSISTTFDMFGLSSACSCTHNSPACMHLITSLPEYSSPAPESTSSSPLPSLYSFQACAISCRAFLFIYQYNFDLFVLSYLRMQEG